jgi:hypothetical protein
MQMPKTLAEWFLTRPGKLFIHEAPYRGVETKMRYSRCSDGKTVWVRSSETRLADGSVVHTLNGVHGLGPLPPRAADGTL